MMSWENISTTILLFLLLAANIDNQRQIRKLQRKVVELAIELQKARKEIIP